LSHSGRAAALREEIPIFTSYVGILFSNKWPMSLRKASHVRDSMIDCQSKPVFAIKGCDGHFGRDPVLGRCMAQVAVNPGQA
jgi:hypothetical protein